MAPTMQVFCDIKTNGVSTKGLNATKGGALYKGMIIKLRC